MPAPTSRVTTLPAPITAPSPIVTLGRIMAPPPIQTRSEERRVGKECRSRCDWSSDVCSSDLYACADIPRDHAAGPDHRAITDRHTRQDNGATADPDEIGRASCRERV